jgi:hypothetical protein
LTKSLILWFETVLPPLLGPNVLVDDFVFDVRHELRKDRFLCDLDANALLDVFLSAWDGHVSKLFNSNKEPRSLCFDLKRHRNKWAHETKMSAREAYRAVDSVEQFLVILAAKVCKFFAFAFA